jgi:hypothetical protein
MGLSSKWRLMDAEVVASILEFLVAFPADPYSVPGPRGVRPAFQYRLVSRRWEQAVSTLTERWLHAISNLTPSVDELGLGPAYLSLLLTAPGSWNCKTRFDLRCVLLVGQHFSAKGHTLSLITDINLPQGVPLTTEDWNRILESFPNLTSLTVDPWQLATLTPLRVKKRCFSRMLELKALNLTRENQPTAIRGDEYLEPLLASNGATDQLPKLESLEVHSLNSVPTFLDFVADNLKCLNKLVMRGCSFTVPEVEAVFPRIGANLRWLDVASCSIEGGGFLKLVAHSCPSLTLLDVSYMLLDFFPAGWDEVFLHCKNLTTLLAPSSDITGGFRDSQLEVLDMCGWSSTKDVESLDSLSKLKSLSFTVHHHRLPEVMGIPIANGFAGHCPEIVSLYLTRVQLSDDGLRELAKCPQLAVISFVAVVGISAEGLRSFLACLSGRLRALALSQGNVTDQLFELLGNPAFVALRQLELTVQATITEGAIVSFLTSSVARALFHLDLSSTPISDLTLQFLGQAKLTRLRYFDVGGTTITDAGIVPIISSCLSLNCLSISAPLDKGSPSSHRVTDAVVEALLETADSALHTGTLSVQGCPGISIDALRRLRRNSQSIDIQSDYKSYDVAPSEWKAIAAAERDFKEWLRADEKIDHQCFGC